jgi:carbon-monoxide dehydrogenase medium subunit
MFISDFIYHRPETLEEACDILDACQDGVLLAGGTDLLVDLKQGTRRHHEVVSLTSIDDLKTIYMEDDALIIGAGATVKQLVRSPLLREHCPAIGEAAGTIGTEQIRNTATVGGNLCTAASCADTAPTLIAYGAEVELVNSRGRRRLSLRDFFTDHRTTALEKAEILSRIFVNIPPPRTGAAYKKHGLRGAANISVASVAARVQIEDDRCTDACFVMGAVAPIPKISNKAIAIVKGKSVSELATFSSAVGRAVAEDAEPIDDIRGSAAYRREVTATMAARAFTEALDRATS